MLRRERTRKFNKRDRPGLTHGDKAAKVVGKYSAGEVVHVAALTRGWLQLADGSNPSSIKVDALQECSEPEAAG